MMQFTKPINLNGTELRQELNAAGVSISDDLNSVSVNGAGELLLDIKEMDEAKATAVVAAHNGTLIAPEQTIADKLASVGLSVADLKEELGL